MSLQWKLDNHVNLQVLERSPSLAAGIEVRPEPMDNFAPDASLSRWARGFSEGHSWLEETWDACLETEPEEDREAPARSTKVGRNAPCPCGTGRKYKHCCGAGSRLS